MISPPADPWENGVLSREAHGRLVMQRDKYAADAGIPAPFIWAKLDDVLPGDDEQAWVRRYKFHRPDGYSGLVYLGNGFDPTIEVRMCGIAGALVRNFIRARVLSMETVYQHMRVGETPEATCLLLPTFAEVRPDDRRSSMIADLLIERWHDSHSQTVVCAPSLEHLGKLYGGFVRDHVAAHYRQIKGAKL
jgi:hypothetical protein